MPITHPDDTSTYIHAMATNESNYSQQTAQHDCGVKVFARLRPKQQERTDNGNNNISTQAWDNQEGRQDDATFSVSDDCEGLTLTLPQDINDPNSNNNASVSHLSNNCNNHTRRYTFQFDRVFEQDASQQQMYDTATAPVVQSFLDGYNGTVFAYGQTGSGKTYTQTGGECYALRGVIPRAISHVFSCLQERAENQDSRVYVSYLEIYNEAVYDLLDRENEHKALDEWTRVVLREGEGGNVHLKNLGVHEVCTEEEALNLLFVGNINRVTSETPMNLASSRSHCIFSINLETRPQDGHGSVFTSKLNLVDLAGSERIYKRRGDERTVLEGKYINLSLHYLEHVITRLYEVSKRPKSSNKGHTSASPQPSNITSSASSATSSLHVPYRNSTLTSVLRDSIGGNCKTVFIVTLNAEVEFAVESLSTCRFAQRCGRLSNSVEMNETVDIQQLVKRLTKENIGLRSKLQKIERNGNNIINNNNNNNSDNKSSEVSTALERGDERRRSSLTPPRPQSAPGGKVKNRPEWNSTSGQSVRRHPRHLPSAARRAHISVAAETGATEMCMDERVDRFLQFGSTKELDLRTLEEALECVHTMRHRWQTSDDADDVRPSLSCEKNKSDSGDEMDIANYKELVVVGEEDEGERADSGRATTSKPTTPRSPGKLTENKSVNDGDDKDEVDSLFGDIDDLSSQFTDQQQLQQQQQQQQNQQIVQDVPRSYSIPSSKLDEQPQKPQQQQESKQTVQDVSRSLSIPSSKKLDERPQQQQQQQQQQGSKQIVHDVSRSLSIPFSKQLDERPQQQQHQHQEQQQQGSKQVAQDVSRSLSIPSSKQLDDISASRRSVAAAAAPVWLDSESKVFETPNAERIGGIGGGGRQERGGEGGGGMGSIGPMNRQFESLLSSGGVFVKHGRYGRPHARYVWVSQDRHHVLWRRVGGDQVHGSLAVSDIACVLRGRSTPVLRRQSGSKNVREGALFSILCENGRSLDLEVDLTYDTSSGDTVAGSASPMAVEQVRKCDQWVAVFTYLVERYKSVQQGGKTKSSSVGAAGAHAGGTAGSSRKVRSLSVSSAGSTASSVGSGFARKFASLMGRSSSTGSGRHASTNAE